MQSCLKVQIFITSLQCLHIIFFLDIHIRSWTETLWKLFHNLQIYYFLVVREMLRSSGIKCRRSSTLTVMWRNICLSKRCYVSSEDIGLARLCAGICRHLYRGLVFTGFKMSIMYEQRADVSEALCLGLSQHLTGWLSRAELSLLPWVWPGCLLPWQSTTHTFL